VLSIEIPHGVRGVIQVLEYGLRSGSIEQVRNVVDVSKDLRQYGRWWTEDRAKEEQFFLGPDRDKQVSEAVLKV
jgi:hypothetical protein